MPTPHRRHQDILQPVVTAKRLWAAGILVGAIFAAGAVARAKVFAAVTGVDAQKLVERQDKVEARTDMVIRELDHLHDDVKGLDDDVRDSSAHRPLKARVEDDWPTPEPHPTPGGTP